jgi:hypothetical protein
MCDTLAAQRWSVNRFHGDGKSPHPRYRNLISWCWHETAQKIRKHQIILPDHPQLIGELTTRRIKYAPDGRLWLESKDELKDRGVASPDFADAFCIAFGMNPVAKATWAQEEDTWKDIAKRHGWEYTEDDDVGRPGRSDGDSGAAWTSTEGYGGVHSDW